jgi:hypothetical protein
MDEILFINMLLSMSYFELMDLSKPDNKIKQFIKNDTFWILKLKQDYNMGYVINMSKSAQQVYFDMYDCIGTTDNITYEDVETDILVGRLERIEIYLPISPKFILPVNMIQINLILKKYLTKAQLELLRKIKYLLRIETDHLDKDYIYTDFIKELAYQESYYGDSHNLPGSFKITYASGSYIIRELSDINIWTLNRVRKELDI